MFTNFTCSSYLIIWHIKIQLNHWQWHNNQWIQSESEIHNQKYHCATILHLSTGTNTGFCICVQKKWNSTKLMNDQKNCQLSENVKHWTKSRGQSSSNRCQRTGVTKTTTKDSGLAYSSKEAAATSLQLLPNLFHFSVQRPPNAWWSQ